MHFFKKTFNYQKKKQKQRIKTTTKAALKNELRYSLLSEGNFCIAEPNLTLKIIQ